LEHRLKNSDAKELVRRLVAARNAGSRTDAGRLLCADARYWDCVRGDVHDRERIAAALTDPTESHVDTRFALDTLAVEGERAVAELRVSGAATSGPFEFVTTEVYSIDGESIASCRVYFDPAELPGRA
jgi:ketosteroid isomerase-like protein